MLRYGLTARLVGTPSDEKPDRTEPGLVGTLVDPDEPLPVVPMPPGILFAPGVFVTVGVSAVGLFVAVPVDVDVEPDGEVPLGLVAVPVLLIPV